MSLLHKHMQFLCAAEHEGGNQKPWSRNLTSPCYRNWMLLLCESKTRIVSGRDRSLVFLMVLAKLYRSSSCIGMEGFRYSVPFLRVLIFQDKIRTGVQNSFQNALETVMLICGRRCSFILSSILQHCLVEKA